jgi:hypothetical protein
MRASASEPLWLRALLWPLFWRYYAAGAALGLTHAAQRAGAPSRVVSILSRMSVWLMQPLLPAWRGR